MPGTGGQGPNAHFYRPAGRHVVNRYGCNVLIAVREAKAGVGVCGRAVPRTWGGQGRPLRKWPLRGGPSDGRQELRRCHERRVLQAWGAAREAERAWCVVAPGGRRGRATWPWPVTQRGRPCSHVALRGNGGLSLTLPPRLVVNLRWSMSVVPHPRSGILLLSSFWWWQQPP